MNYKRSSSYHIQYNAIPSNSFWWMRNVASTCGDLSTVVRKTRIKSWSCSSLSPIISRFRACMSALKCKRRIAQITVAQRTMTGLKSILTGRYFIGPRVYISLPLKIRTCDLRTVFSFSKLLRNDRSFSSWNIFAFDSFSS